MNALAQTIATETEGIELARGYTESQRIKALAVWAETGSVPKASAESGIALSTLYRMVNSSDWKDLAQKMRQAIRESVGWLAVQNLIAAQDAIRDRLANGDERLDKNGSVKRVKVSGRDAAAISLATKELMASLTQGMEASEATATLTTLAEALVTELAERRKAAPPPAPTTPHPASAYLG